MSDLDFVRKDLSNHAFLKFMRNFEAIALLAYSIYFNKTILEDPLSKEDVELKNALALKTLEDVTNEFDFEVRNNCLLLNQKETNEYLDHILLQYEKLGKILDERLDDIDEENPIRITVELLYSNFVTEIYGYWYKTFYDESLNHIDSKDHITLGLSAKEITPNEIEIDGPEHPLFHLIESINLMCHYVFGKDSTKKQVDFFKFRDTFEGWLEYEKKLKPFLKYLTQKELELGVREFITFFNDTVIKLNPYFEKLESIIQENYDLISEEMKSKISNYTDFKIDIWQAKLLCGFLMVNEIKMYIDAVVKRCDYFKEQINKSPLSEIEESPDDETTTKQQYIILQRLGIIELLTDQFGMNKTNIAKLLGKLLNRSTKDRNHITAIQNIKNLVYYNTDNLRAVDKIFRKVGLTDEAVQLQKETGIK